MGTVFADAPPVRLGLGLAGRGLHPRRPVPRQRREVIRAELPGIDPDKDVELTVIDGILRINAERRVESKTEDKGYLRHELHYGSLTRTLPLPDGIKEADITASYKNGILEIRVPVLEQPPEREPKKIAITKG